MLIFDKTTRNSWLEIASRKTLVCWDQRSKHRRKLSFWPTKSANWIADCFTFEDETRCFSGCLPACCASLHYWELGLGAFRKARCFLYSFCLLPNIWDFAVKVSLYRRGQVSTQREKILRRNNVIWQEFFSLPASCGSLFEKVDPCYLVRFAIWVIS